MGQSPRGGGPHWTQLPCYPSIPPKIMPKVSSWGPVTGFLMPPLALNLISWYSANQPPMTHSYRVSETMNERTNPEHLPVLLHLL